MDSRIHEIFKIFLYLILSLQTLKPLKLKPLLSSIFPSQVVDSWYSEVSDYKFTASPWTDNSGSFYQIGHFTQLVGDFEVLRGKVVAGVSCL